jgi:hypothetical protein
MLSHPQVWAHETVSPLLPKRPFSDLFSLTWVNPYSTEPQNPHLGGGYGR